MSRFCTILIVETGYAQDWRKLLPHWAATPPGSVTQVPLRLPLWEALRHLLLLVLIIAGLCGGCLILAVRGQALADISAASPSLPPASPSLPLTVLVVRWERSSGWSRPLLQDHAELAAAEQAQLAASRARRGWRPISRALTSHSDKRTHCRRPVAFDSGPEQAPGPLLPPPSRSIGSSEQALGVPCSSSLVEDSDLESSATGHRCDYCATLEAVCLPCLARAGLRPAYSTTRPCSFLKTNHLTPYYSTILFGIYFNLLFDSY